MRKIVTDNGRIIRGLVFNNDPTHLQRWDLTDVAMWVKNSNPDMSIVEVCVDEDEEGNATYRYIIMEDRTVQDEGLTLEELNKSLESYIADDDFFEDVEWELKRHPEDPRLKCLEVARDKLNEQMRKMPWKDAMEVLDQYWEEHWREIVPTLPKDEEKEICNDGNYDVICVYKDTLRGWFTESEMDEDNLAYILIDKKTAEKWYDEYMDEDVKAKCDYNKWNTYESTADETMLFAAWLKNKGFQFYRVDFETVIAKKQ